MPRYGFKRRPDPSHHQSTRLIVELMIFRVIAVAVDVLKLKVAIGHALAVVFKDKVMSYPIVNCQIEGGKVEITGNFTEQVANDFVGIFYGKK